MTNLSLQTGYSRCVILVRLLKQCLDIFKRCVTKLSKQIDFSFWCNVPASQHDDAMIRAMPASSVKTAQTYRVSFLRPLSRIPPNSNGCLFVLLILAALIAIHRKPQTRRVAEDSTRLYGEATQRRMRLLGIAIYSWDSGSVLIRLAIKIPLLRLF